MIMISVKEKILMPYTHMALMAVWCIIMQVEG